MRKRKKSCNYIIVLMLILLFSISIGYSALSSTLSMSGIVSISAPPTTYPVKYAVQIYGINEDVDKNGEAIGLTFGPAIGDNYNNKYVTHEYEETSTGSGVYNVKIVTHTIASNGTESTTSEFLYKNGETTEKVTRTEEEKNKYEINIHEMTWGDIALVADKTDFLDCMLCGDTKKVELYLNDTIGAGTTPTQYGDGAGVLYGVINSYYRKWNPRVSDNSAVGTGVTLENGEQSYGSNARNNGGYSVSHIRATLIGENEKTNEGYAGDVNLNESNSLYSCLPSSLKNVIIAKKVRYVTGTSESNYSLNDDIEDKIWAFSSREMYGTGEYTGTTTEGLGNDGHGYSKFSNVDSKYYISSYNNNNVTQRMCYNELDHEDELWLRSPYLSYAYYAYEMYGGGGTGNGGFPYLNLHGLSFGFCIN